MHSDWRKKTPHWLCSHQLLQQQAWRVPPFFHYNEGLGVPCRYCTASAQAWSALYEPKYWRLFIDSSKRALKCVLLHNGNQLASVPIAHSTTLKENYETVEYVLEKIGYDQHKWFICVDLKMVNFLLGQQSGFSKCPCFLCMWECRDRAQHYAKKDWLLREELVPCKERNVINDPLVDRDRILFPPLHIKLSLIKQFAKVLGKDGDSFTYLCQAFPGLTMEKLKAGIFDGPQIRQLIRDPEFENSKNEVELEAWKAFVLVVKNFLDNNEARNYAELVNNMMTAFRYLGCNMSDRMHYLFSHIVLRTWVQGVTSRTRDSIRTLKRWRPGLMVTWTQSWWLTTVGIWRETFLPLSIPGVRRNGSSIPEVWTMVKQHAIYVYLPLSTPTIQFTVIDVSIR